MSDLNIIEDVLGNDGGLYTVAFDSSTGPKYITSAHGLTEIRAFVGFPCGDAFVTWLPVFTEIFTEWFE